MDEIRNIDMFSGNPIRRTDNSARERDSYPCDQSPKPLELEGGKPVGWEVPDDDGE